MRIIGHQVQEIRGTMHTERTILATRFDLASLDQKLPQPELWQWKGTLFAGCV